MAKSTRRPAMKYYILANGEGTRWHNYKGVPKQLIEIDGETILHRMIRLLREEGVAKKNIIICGPFKDAEATSKITKSKTKREVFEEIANLAKGPFTILYGDCYYTKECIHEIVTRPIKKYDEFYTVYPNPNTGCPWPEGYAHRCEDWEWWRDTMHEINTNAQLISTPKDWFIHWWLLGVRDERINTPPVENFNPDHDIAWMDETDDFDYPVDLDRFCDTTGHKCTNIEPEVIERPDFLSIIIPAYNAEKTLDRVLGELVSQKMQQPENAEIIVVDDGSTDGTKDVVAKYGTIVRYIHQENKGVAAARNVGLDASRGRYISFVDADDNVYPNYIATIVKELRQGYDYAVFCYHDGKTDSICFNLFKPLPHAAVWGYAYNYNAIKDYRFDETLQVSEDYEWLKITLAEGRGLKRAQIGEILYDYDWNANPDSLCKKYNRGEIGLKRDK